MPIPKADPSKIKSTKSLALDPKIKALLLGPSKSGKTTSLLTLPGKSLHFDLDQRVECLAGAENIDTISIFDEDPAAGAAWLELENWGSWIWDQVKSGEFPYSGVMFDGLSGMNKLCMNHVITLRRSDGSKAELGFGGVPAQHHYNPYMSRMSKFIFNILALPLHVIFTGHYYVYEDSTTNRIEWWPKVFGNIRTEIGSWFNETYALYSVREKKGDEYKHRYFWQTAADRKLGFVGSSLNQLGKYWSSPVEIDFSQERTGFAELLHRRFGGD